MGANYVRNMLKKARSIIPLTVCSTTASVANNTLSSTAYGENFECTLYVKTGPVYMNSLVTATTANGFELASGMTIDIKSESILSLISDSTLAKFEAIVWE
jgi:surface polysaccharide O-acyltransferase-like enzyme